MTENPYLEALARVTAGRTASFAELARLAGRPAAARAAGRAVAAVPTADPRPWHRIVRSDGGLAPDPARARTQLERLRQEGARPPLAADVDAWLKRRRARCVGLWTNRMLFDAGDPRLPRVDSTRLEAIRDPEQGFERGFYLAPPPRQASASRAADSPPRAKNAQLPATAGRSSAGRTRRAPREKGTVDHAGSKPAVAARVARRSSKPKGPPSKSKGAPTDPVARTPSRTRTGST